jgi:8-oxo-dGTP pyrophosphatase MutT (NUDIX family)
MERISTNTTHEGKLSTVRVDEFRYQDGETAEREIVAHPGAVGIVARDDEIVYMVRQPREAVGEASLLELPAGKLDVEGESPLDCAKRELVEEVGVKASSWEEITRFYSSPGFTDEQVFLFIATGLTEVGAQPTAGERIEIVKLPLTDLDATIEVCEDAKSLIGLLTLRERLRRSAAA